MKMITKKIRSAFLAGSLAFGGTAVVATGVATLVIPTEAEAGCCFAYNDGVIYGYIAAAEAAIKAHFTVQQLAVIATLQQHAGQMSGNLKEQTAADARMRTVEDQREVQRRIEDVKVKALLENQPSPSACNVITGASKTGQLDRHVKNLTKVLTEEHVGLDAGRVGGLESTDKILTARNSAHCANFATEADIKSGFCPVGTPIASNELQNLNLNIETAMSAKNGVMTGEEALASTQFISTAFAPSPIGIRVTNGQDKSLLSARQASVARASIATSVGSRIHADRTQFYTNGETGGDMHKYSEELAKQVMGYDSEGNNFPVGISRSGFDELRSKGWYFNPNWAVTAATRPDGDMVLMTAYSVYQTWQTNERLDEISVTLAALLANMEERDRREFLSRQ